MDALHDSITTVGNGGDAATKARFLVYYDMPGAKGSQVPYELDQTIQPGEHMWVNIGDLISRQVPDVHGKVLPAALTSGTYEFKDMTDRAHGNLFEGKVIVDKTYGHATYGCAECCGHNRGTMQPWSILLGFSANGSILDQNSCETFPEDITDLFSSWSSANTAIATVDNTGLGQGMGVGSAAIRAEAFAVEKDLGGADMLHCPTNLLQSNGPATVQVPTYFFASSAVNVQGACYSPSVGSFFNVSYTVQDQNSNPIAIAGMTPLEKSVGMTQYGPFALPSTTSGTGSFNDDPVGSCFTFKAGTPAGTQACNATFTVTYQDMLSATTYPISTSTIRTDCALGQTLQIQGNNPTSQNKTFTQGKTN